MANNQAEELFAASAAATQAESAPVAPEATSEQPATDAPADDATDASATPVVTSAAALFAQFALAKPADAPEKKNADAVTAQLEASGKCARYNTQRVCNITVTEKEKHICVTLQIKNKIGGVEVDGKFYGNVAYKNAVNVVTNGIGETNVLTVSLIELKAVLMGNAKASMLAGPLGGDIHKDFEKIEKCLRVLLIESEIDFLAQIVAPNEEYTNPYSTNPGTPITRAYATVRHHLVGYTPSSTVDAAYERYLSF